MCPANWSTSLSKPVQRKVLALRRRALALTAGLLVAGASGCGFKLRESADIPFAKLYNNLGRGSGLGNAFATHVRVAGGTVLVDDRESADAVVELVGEVRQKEAVSFSISGSPREYELRYQVIFRVLDPNGVAYLRPTTIILRRYITTSDVELLAEELEENFLYREMQKDMVQQILRRLAAIELPR